MKNIFLKITPIFLVLLTVSCNDKETSYSEIGIDTEWISEIVEYRPAVGQFINKDAIGTLEAANKIIGGRNNTVSLGGFGGSITFRFKHDVLNQTGTDFVIFSNAFQNSCEPGIVMVSYDANGNGLADDEWYELLGDETNTTPDYKVTWTKPSVTNVAENVFWTDSKGDSGFYDVSKVINYQCFYPLFVDNAPATLEYSGRRLADNGVLGPFLWEFRPVGRGYVDNYSDDYEETVGGLEITKKSNKFDISRAINKNGNKVKLNRITFIKVYTAVHQIAEVSVAGAGLSVGECSTEVAGALSLSVAK